MGTLEDVIKSLMRKFIHKDLRESCSEMAKLVFNNVNNQKPTHLVNLGFTVNHEIQLWKSSKKISDSEITNCSKSQYSKFDPPIFSFFTNTRAVLSILISFVLLISAFFIILDAQNSVVAACSQGCLFVIDF